MPLTEQEQIKLADLAVKRETYQVDLLESLNGSLPFSQANLPFTPAQDMMNHPLNVRREKAYKKLTDMGMTRQQIQLVLDIQKELKPNFISSLKHNIGEEAGGLAGGIAGAKLAGVLGQLGPLAVLPDELITVPLFAAGGAFLGGGTGKSIQQYVSPYESPSLSSFTAAGLRQGAWEAGGRIAGKALQYTPLYKKERIMPDDVKNLFRQYDISPSPRALDKRVAVGIPEEISRGSFGGENIWSQFDTDIQEKLIKAGRDIVNTIAGRAVSDTELMKSAAGKELFEMFVKKGEKGILEPGLRHTLLKDIFDPLYKHVNTLSPNARFSTVPIKEFMERKLAEDAAQGGGVMSAKARSMFNRSLKTLNTRRTLNQMKELRSSYLADARMFALSGDKSNAVFAELADVADQALFNPTTVKGMTPEAADYLRKVNSLYATTKSMMNSNEFIKAVVNHLGTSPGTKVSKTVFSDFDYNRLKNIRDMLMNPIPSRTGFGSVERNVSQQLTDIKKMLPTEIKGGQKVLDLLTSSQAEGQALWKRLSAGWLAENVEDAIDVKSNMFNIAKFKKKINAIPKDSFSLMFPGDQGRSIKTLINAFETVSPPKRGFVSMFGKAIELQALSTPSTLAAGHGIAATGQGALSITPWAFAKLGTNPKAIPYLVAGLRQNKNAIKTAPIAARLIKILQDDINEERRNITKEYLRKQQIERMREASIATPSGYYRSFGGRGV